MIQAATSNLINSAPQLSCAWDQTKDIVRARCLYE